MKKWEKNLFIVCNSCQNSLLSYQNETMPHGKVLCWRKAPWVFFLWERYVLVNCLTGCLWSDKEMGTTVTKHSQDPQSEFAGSLAQLCWEASIAHLFLLDFFFNATSHCFVPKPSTELSVCCCCTFTLPKLPDWVPPFWADEHLSSSFPPPAAGCEHRAFAFLAAGRMCLPTCAAGSEFNSSVENGYFQPRIFPSIWKLLLSFPNKPLWLPAMTHSGNGLSWFLSFELN